MPRDSTVFLRLTIETEPNGYILGTLEPNKEATLIVTDGDPLEIRTHVLRAFIAGRETSLDNRQHRLYEKYLGKPESGSR